MGKKSKVILCDSNILFALLNGDEEIQSNLKKIGEKNIAFSIITYAEAYAGSSKDDTKALKKFFEKPALPFE